MTVCVGVLCANSFEVVVAADRMVTAGDTEFEQRDIRKIEPINERCVILTSGSALRHTDLARRVKDELRGRSHPSVMDVVVELKRQFVEARKTRAEELHLKPLGMDLEQFLHTQGRLAEPLVLRLTRNIEDEALRLSILVAGTDSTGGHIYYVYDPGTADCFDAIGYCGIGAGEHHAELSLIRAHYSPKVSVKQAVFLTYQAKRDAEVAPGVGANFTDVATLDEKGCHFLDQDVLAVLSSIYEELTRSRVGIREEMREKIEGVEIKFQ